MTPRVRERTIFFEVLERASPAERAAYLDAACADDPALRERVDALLRSHDEAGEFLNLPAPERLGDGLAPGQAADDTQTGPAAANVDEPLDFLKPSDKPGSLGRLGHYEVEQVVGRGGMGVVLKAFDENLHRVVAIKVMAPQLATSATARRRFTREARAAAAVTQDHVVTIHGVEEADALPYIVMQYVDGVSLQDRLDRTGPLPLTELLRIGMQAASGLAAAHAQGLVHRDVKPANILLENGVERVKLTDFGLARAADDASLTQSGVIAGTPQYMSPEQAEGGSVDHRSDLFSLGSVLYAMCTGRPPFRGSTARAVLKRVVEDAPPAIRETNPEVPSWLADLIARLHSKDPAGRFRSAEEVADLLGRKLAELQHPSQASAPAAEPARAAAPGGHPRRRWAVAAAALVLLTAGLGLTEAAGVTKLQATVIRIFTPDGTLVVEADDPDVKVTVEGDGDLVITGAGAKEVRLRPGSYRVRATKDGKPVHLDRDLVTITHGHRQVVRVRVEGDAPHAAVAPKAESGAFVVLRSTGVAERRFDTLAAAVIGAGDGDTIEIRGNGLFISQPIYTARPLTIRAGAGFSPTIQLDPLAPSPLLASESPALVLEGIEFALLVRPPGEQRAPGILMQTGGTLRVTNCRFVRNVGMQGACVTCTDTTRSVFRNTEFIRLGPGGGVGISHGCPTTGTGSLTVENCTDLGTYHMLLVVLDARKVRQVSIQLRHNTSVADVAVYFSTSGLSPSLAKEKSRTPTPPVSVESAGNLFQSRNHLLTFGPKDAAGIRLPAETQAELCRRYCAWREDGSLYPERVGLTLVNTDAGELTHSIATVRTDWGHFWQQGATASPAGTPAFSGGNMYALARSAERRLKADDFRLLPGSPGSRAGRDGKDLGADVDLVGPGKAYERWKRTPEYQQWLKETGQKK